MDAILIEKNILQDERNILQAEKEDLQKRYLAECSLSKKLKQSLSAALDLSQNSDCEIGEPGSLIPVHVEPTQLLSKSHSSQDLGSADFVKDESSLEVALRSALEDGKYCHTCTCCVLYVFDISSSPSHSLRTCNEDSMYTDMPIHMQTLIYKHTHRYIHIDTCMYISHINSYVLTWQEI